MGSTRLVEFLLQWTADNEAPLRREGIAISLVFPHDPSAVAVAVLCAEPQPDSLAVDLVGAADFMGHLALAADGLCVVELIDTESGETRYKSATTTADEGDLLACLNDFLTRVRS